MPRKPTPKRSVDAKGNLRVHGKLANGEGSVYFAADGRWRATYRVAGEKRPRTVSGMTREKALAARERKLAELGEGVLLKSDMSPTISIGELAHWWLHNIQRHRVRASTWAKAEDRVRRITATLGAIQVRKLRVEHIVEWQSQLLTELAPKTVVHHRQTLGQVMEAAIDLGLIANNPVRRVKPPRVPKHHGRRLTVTECHALVNAASDDRLGGVVALLFLQGWRVSEVLGLAWEDVDFENATAKVRRACVYIDGQGSALGPTKTTGAMGEHRLVPTAVELLRRRRKTQAAEQLQAGEAWTTHEYEGESLALVFTTPDGGLVGRQQVTKTLRAAALRAGIDPERLGTHVGRRSVVTALYAEAGESLEEIALFVGHASTQTTAGYVSDLGTRPAEFAKRAAQLLDPQLNATPGAGN